MGKTTSVRYSKLTKKIIIIGIITGIISIIVGLGIWIYRAQFNDICTVKYVQWHDEIVVQTYYKGEKISFPDNPVKIGYDFVGWSLDKSEDKILTQEILVQEELTLYARWKEQVYTLVYDDKEISLTYEDSFAITDDALIIYTGSKEICIGNPILNGKKVVDWQISDGINSISIGDFSFKDVASDRLSLIPVYEDILLSFDIIGSSEYYDIEMSHEYIVRQNDTLSLTLTLHESVSMSEVDISTTSGDINVLEEENVYYITINDFTEDFNIYISNITINKYIITFNNEGTITTQEFEHGDYLTLPDIARDGHRLIAFTDSNGREYSESDVVSSSLTLNAIWEEETYTISFPKNNGMYLISVENETLTTSKDIYKKYLEDIEFSISLSKAYNKSEYIVYANTSNGMVYPVINGDRHVFNNISSDMEIVIDNVSLNTYAVIVDGKEHGKFSYGSWIYVDGDTIWVRDSLTNMITDIETIIDDSNFGGWICNGMIVSNCIVQDIADDNGDIIINGNYSKKVTRVHLVVNGGELDITEIILVEGEEITLPQPIRSGYTFAGWYITLVEVNTIVDQSASVKFDGTDELCITLYAGWTK